MGQAPINDGINRRSSKVRKSPQPGPAVIRAGNYLAVVCLFFGVAFAAFVSGPLEQRVDLFWFGLIPAIGFYLGGNILGRLLVLGVKLCDMMTARCSRYAVRLANDFLSWAGRQVSNWFTGASERGSKLRVQMPTNFVRDSGWKLWFVIIVGLFLTSAIYGWLGTSASYWQPDSQREELITTAPVHAVVEQIIRVESGGDPNAQNKRSSATGLGQFLDETWLDMIRTHRPDLAKGRNQAEILELRRGAKIAREITARFTERNAQMLRKRGLPVTPGALYLAHFAGAAGAVAVLSAMENADAALVMAMADTTGRTNRERIIKANPFLEGFTVADLRNWADRKMHVPGQWLPGVLAVPSLD
jgi:hypothetical protein